MRIRLSSRGARAGASRSGLWWFVFGFLRRLPKEQIWTDRRTENRDDGDRIGAVELEKRHQRAVRDIRPIDLDHERCGDIGEQRQCRPLQQIDVASIAHEHFEKHAQRTERDDIQQVRSANEEAKSVGHRAKIGAEVDDVGSEQD
jgi:hypothetical protein